MEGRQDERLAKERLNFRMQVLTTDVLWEDYLPSTHSSSEQPLLPHRRPHEAVSAPNSPTPNSARPLRTKLELQGPPRNCACAQSMEPNQRNRGEGGGVSRATDVGWTSGDPTESFHLAGSERLYRPFVTYSVHVPRSTVSACVLSHAFRLPTLAVGGNLRHPTSDTLLSAH